MIAKGKTKSECLNNLKSFIETNGKNNILKQVEQFTTKITKNAGQNPLYKTV
jgi:hypothetical protein